MTSIFCYLKKATNYFIIINKTVYKKQKPTQAINLYFESTAFTQCAVKTRGSVFLVLPNQTALVKQTAASSSLLHTPGQARQLQQTETEEVYDFHYDPKDTRLSHHFTLFNS